MSPDEDNDDPRERKAEEQEPVLDAREDKARDVALGAELKPEVQAILDDADERDKRADARDSEADDRDKAESLQSFLHDEDFAPGVKARQAAGMDRLDSKSDRASAAEDRSKLAEGGSTHSDPEDGEDVTS